MNALFNHANKLSQSLKRDLESVECAPSSCSPSMIGQISASISAFVRAIDDYNDLAKSELDREKKDKALDRIITFRKEVVDARERLGKVKAAREEAITAANKSELIGRRGFEAPTPDNPFVYQPTGGPASGQSFGKTGPAQSGLSLEAGLNKESNVLSQAGLQIDEFIARGKLVLGDLHEQREMMKNAQKKIYRVANTLGISNDTIRMVERRAKQDKWIFLACVLFTFVCFYYILKWFR